MALTQPELSPTVSAAVCASVDFLGSTLRFGLNPDQVSEWSDADLAAKMQALKAGIAGLLPANMSSVSVYVEWDSNATVTTNTI